MRVISFFLAVGSLFAADALHDGLAAFNEGRYSVALAKLKQADPRDPTARAFLALTEAAMGDCKTALPALTSTSDANPTLYRLTGLAAIKCSDTNQALVLLQRLESKFPSDPDVLYTAAKLHMKAFNDATYAMYQRAPSSYRVHELSAEVFEVEARYPDAVSEYRKAIELNPNAPDLHFRLGRALLLQSHEAKALDEATTAFRAELKLNPEDGACEFQLGQIAQVEGQASEAEAHFQRAAELSPNLVPALIALGKIHTQKKDYPAAIGLLKRATDIQPENETAHYALLTAYRDSGDMQNAKAEKAILDRLQKPPEGEFSQFLKKLGEKQPEQ